MLGISFNLADLKPTKTLKTKMKNSNHTNSRSIIVDSLKRRFYEFTGLLNNRSNSYDIYLSIGILICLTSPLWAQIVAHISSNYLEFDNPDFVAVWGITEWLISYDGGFVRRGITGELVKVFSLLLSIPANYVIVGLCMLIYIIVMIWTIRICKDTIPIYLIMSSLLLGAPIFTGFIIRKDVLLSLIFMCSIFVISSHYNRRTRILFLNILTSFAILAHEMYFFIGLPLVVAIYNLQTKQRIFTFNSILLVAIPIVLMIFLLFHRGDNELAQLIIEYWDNLHSEIAPTYCCLNEPVAAIFALSNLDWHTETNFHHWTLVLYGFMWNPLIWICLWLACGYFLVRFIQHYDFGRENVFLGMYIFQTICALPFFFIAWDYGRWILLIAFLSFIATYLLKNFSNINLFEKFSLIQFQKKTMTLWQKLIIVFFFGIPHLWLNVDYQLYVIPILDFIFNLDP